MTLPLSRRGPRPHRPAVARVGCQDADRAERHRARYGDERDPLRRAQTAQLTERPRLRVRHELIYDRGLFMTNHAVLNSREPGSRAERGGGRKVWPTALPGASPR